MTSSSTRLRISGAIAATSLAVFLGLSGTAFADAGQGEQHRNDQAGTPSHATTGPTEGTDTNDGGTPNNVVDAGDNMHPSGKDRSVENGGSGNQGSAASEPDQNGTGPERDHGGLDTPDGPGGVDLADQEGNNGCGNDDDFEDDNEGLCGGPAKTSTSPPLEVHVEQHHEVVVVDADTLTPAAVLASQLQNETPAAPAQVLGVTLERPAAPAAVLGVSATRGTALARTGFGTGVLVLLAIGLLLAGFAMVRRPKGLHSTR